MLCMGKKIYKKEKYITILVFLEIEIEIQAAMPRNSLRVRRHCSGTMI